MVVAPTKPPTTVTTLTWGMCEHAAMAHDSMIACCGSLLFTVASQTKSRGPTRMSVRQSVTQMRQRVCCSFYSLAIWPTMWRSLAQGRHSAPVTMSWGRRCGPTPTSNVARLSFHFVLSLFFVATKTYNSLFVAVQNYRLPHCHLFRIFLSSHCHYRCMNKPYSLDCHPYR